MADTNQPWWILAAAGLPPLVITWWQRHRDSEDKRAERAMNERGRLMASMDTATLASFERLEKDLLRERTRREALEAENDKLAREKDHLWDLLHAWRRLARSLRHEVGNARQMIRTLQPDAPPERWADVPPLPDVDKIEV